MKTTEALYRTIPECYWNRKIILFGVQYKRDSKWVAVPKFNTIKTFYEIRHYLGRTEIMFRIGVIL